jgi:hypothetical protein
VKNDAHRGLRFLYANNFMLLKILLLSLFFTAKIEALAEWTVLVYVQANNNLYQYSEKNFSDMASIGSTDKLNVLIEWHQPTKKGTWRYKIDKEKMTFDACIPVDSDGNNPQDLVSAMQWAVSKYPAKKYALVLWDHGIGILDPVWGKYHPWTNQKNLVNPITVKNNPRIQINGITTKKNKSKKNNKNPHKLRLNENKAIDFTRGILFNEQSRTYMTNQLLSSALSQIKTTVLNGKKIDLIGMDACLMAMVEIAYQTKDYADVLVASEEVELAHGWHYAPFLNILSKEILSPAQLAQSIVLTYEHYYKERVQFFTQSAINLGQMDLLKQSIDNIVISAQKCKNTNIPIDSIIKKARAASLQFSAPSYIDLHSFLIEFQKNVSSISPATTITNDLKAAISMSTKLIENSVIALAAGRHLNRAKGLSIYFPTSGIDASYVKTDFAKESLWLNVLSGLIA